MCEKNGGMDDGVEIEKKWVVHRVDGVAKKQKTKYFFSLLMKL